ncbi:MAG: hypothetical protein KAX30_07690 [Candidatus Atribacteria bacterium]|nr:hypothetical protein [Candidatus Atribacteria bacterium]
MNGLRWNSISRSIGDIGRQIAEVDERLADLFRRIAEILPDEKRGREESELDGKRTNERIVKGIIGKIGIGGAINTIPFGEPCGCLEECLAIAFGKLKSKYGFNQIVKKVIDYWLICSKENYRTLIVTNAWDITDFYSKFKGHFDSHTFSKNKDSIKHTVAIVLYGDYGFSLYYLG